MQAHCSSAAAARDARVDATLAILNSSLAQTPSARRTKAAQLCPGRLGIVRVVWHSCNGHSPFHDPHGADICSADSGGATCEMRFSIVVPTLNRHEVLREALSSIRSQTFADWEVIVVDDGSNPRVTIHEVTEAGGPTTKLICHDTTRGMPTVNNTGLAHASGDIVIYLDDDDLLADGTLAELDAHFRLHQEVDCIFMNVRAFGANAAQSNANQEKAVAEVLKEVSVKEEDGLWLLGPETFDALLNRIPVAFQRPAARQRAWKIVGGFNLETPYSRSEWAVRASTQCRVALTKRPLQLWRVDNQNYFSVPEKYRFGLDAALATLHALLRRFKQVDAGKARRIRRHLGDAYFGKAWAIRSIDGEVDWESLARSIRYRPHIRVLRFAFRSVLSWRTSRSRWRRAG